MTEIKSKETLLAELREFLRVYAPGLDTSDNSLSKDLLLTPYSIGGEAIMDQVAVARDLQILSRLVGGDLDNEGTNFNKERLAGSYSTVTITFFANAIPTSSIIIPAGTQVRTAGTAFVSPVTFSTISEARFTVADAASYYSYDRDRYEFNVTALCDTIGTVGNVTSGMVVQLVGSVTGIDGVTNLTAATGGENEESDDDFRTRIQLVNLGRDLNTVNGLKEYMKSVGFVDAYPIRVENAEAERATGIDVFVINNSSSPASEVFTYDPSQSRYYMTNRPVLEVTSVVGSISGTLSLSDYDINLDNSSPMRRSVYSLDYITFRAPAALVTGESITITYNYAPLIRQTQDTLDLNENKILTADPLLKAAYPLYLYITAAISLKANADGSSTRNKCRNALSQFLSAYRLGDDIQKSDLIVVLQQGYGDYPVDTVDAVVINSYYLQDVSGNRYQPVNEIISVSNKQYAVYGSATLTS